MTINYTLARQTSARRRTGEHYYVEIDSDRLGTLCLCEPGEETATGGRPWLYEGAPIANIEEGERETQAVTLLLNQQAVDRIATEPLENHVCRIYRYRDTFAHRELLRVGRVWSDTTGAGAGIFRYQVIGNLALDLQGLLPTRVFDWQLYRELPESYLAAGIPLVLGDVSGWTPPLVKGGGWGYLSEDIPPQPMTAFDGYIPIVSPRGISFSRDVAASTQLAEACNEYQSYLKINSLTNLLKDDGTGFVLVTDSTGTVAEIMRALDSNTSGGNWLDPVFRAVLKRADITGPNAFASGSPVYAIGLVVIDDEILAYMRRDGSGLYQVMGGINKPSQEHKAGALVREWMPVFKWLVSARAAKELKKNKVFFYLSQYDRLVSNPFPELTVDASDTDTESGRTVATVTLKSQYQSVYVGPDSHRTPDTVSREILTLSSSSFEDDPDSNWSDAGNVIDETSVVPGEDTPTTYATYSPTVTTTTYYTERKIASVPTSWTDDDKAHDGDDTTYAYTDIPDDSYAYYQIQLDAAPSNDTYVKKVVAKVKATETDSQGFNASVFFAGRSQVITDSGGTDWQELTIYETGGINTDLEDYFTDGDNYTATPDNDGIFVQIYGAKVTGKSSKLVVYEGALEISTVHPGKWRGRYTGTPTHTADTIGTEIWIYVSGGTWKVTWDEGADDAITWTGAASGWLRIVVDDGDFATAADWQKYIRVSKEDSTNSGYLYDCKLVNLYQAYGSWNRLEAAYDGDEATYCYYQASTGGNHYAEFNRAHAVNTPLFIERVRVRIKYYNQLSVNCQVGINTAGGNEASVTQWYNLPASGDNYTAFVDVTDSADGPGAEQWTWQDLTDYSIYLKVQGTDGETLKIYEIGWDILTGVKDIDPAQTPLVVEVEGVDDPIGGIYTSGGGLIENPADIERFLLLGELGITEDKIDLDAYTALRTHFDGLGIKAAGVIFKRETADEFFRRFRAQFLYSVDEVAGKLTPKWWPASTEDATATIDESVIREGGFVRSRTGMEEVCNYPIAYYHLAYYTSQKDTAILYGSEQTERPPLIRRQWGNPLLVDNSNIQRQWRGKAEITDLAGGTFDEYLALAQASYVAYGQWFRQPVEMDFVRDEDTAKALIAEKIRRYAFQRWRFEIDVDPSVADKLKKWDVVTVEHRLVPRIPGKTTRVRHYTGHIYSVKCVILGIRSVGDGTPWRRILVEVL